MEIAVSTRDCLVVNKALWENAVDCGGALLDVVINGAKYAALVSSVGAPIAAGRQLADDAESIAQAATKIAQVAAKAPPRVM